MSREEVCYSIRDLRGYSSSARIIPFQGIDAGSIPATRSLGEFFAWISYFSLKIKYKPGSTQVFSFLELSLEGEDTSEESRT